MSSTLYQLTATEVLAKIKYGDVTVEDYARSLLKRIESRDEAVQAWAYLNPDYVIKQAQALDAVPQSERGPLHGVAIAVKDVIYTKREFIPGRVQRHHF
jgi:Asp-tRNA(Asn)/Glu-tRNA(Gln) amidotransferase A subunit family amidase